MKIAVIDIGTRATKLLISDTDDLKEYGFDFRHYFNDGDRTEAGKGIYIDESETCLYYMKSLKKTIEYTKYLLSECRRRNVSKENIYTVGTELFRRVSNWRDVVTIIENACEIDLKVLDPIEEAQSTFWSAVITCKDYYNTDEPILVFEQGGGSVQLTVGAINKQSGKIESYGQTSIPELGTLLLAEMFLQHDSSNRYVKTVHREVSLFAQTKISDVLATEFSLTKYEKPFKAFALGSVITNISNLANKHIHGKEVSLSQLQSDPVADTVLERYKDYSLKGLFKDIKNGQIQESNEAINRILERSYGFPCYAAVLEYFNLKKLHICGTGLRYGIFFRIADKDWNNIKEFQGKDNGSQITPNRNNSEVLKLIEIGENLTTEYKASARHNNNTNKDDRNITKGILKTIAAFLNTKGGKLVIGVDNDKHIVGLNSDFQYLTNRPNIDGYAGFLNDIVKTRIGIAYFKFIEIKFYKIDNNDICLINIKPSSKPAYVRLKENDSNFYIRLEGSTELLTTQEAVEYVKTHEEFK